MTTVAQDPHVSPLMAMLYPAYTRRCDHCGGYVAMPPDEALRRWAETTYQPLAKLAGALQEATVRSAEGLPTMTPSETLGTGYLAQWGTHGHHHHHGHHPECGCRDCGKDDCHCRCCIVDADLVVSARLGERRVVPITIENNRRREREIKLELSEFTSKGGSPTDVTGRLLPPEEFTLEPCQETQAIILIGTKGEGGEQIEEEPVAAVEGKAATKRRTAAAKKEEEEAEEERRRELGRRRYPDVDECSVAYADLRVVGCDNRPVRIAVSVLPRDCHAYPVDCICGCC